MILTKKAADLVTYYELTTLRDGTFFDFPLYVGDVSLPYKISVVVICAMVANVEQLPFSIWSRNFRQRLLTENFFRKNSFLKNV